MSINKNNFSNSFNDITQLESLALKSNFNLSDAHTHQSQSSSQLKIVKNLPNLWCDSEKCTQFDMEQKFIKTFFRVNKQEHALKNMDKVLLTYAASISMSIVSTFLKNKKLSTALLHPCFDNLYDLLKYTEVEIATLEENWFYKPDQIYQNLKDNIKTDAILIVEPNNPTGFSLSVNGLTGWQELIRFAKENNKLLVFDFCFSAFMHDNKVAKLFDRYALLDQSGVSYIAIEDTGKTWPLQDTKVSLIKMSDDLFNDLYNIHSAYLLNVSPFILNIVTQYILDSEKDNFFSVSSLINRNRRIAEEKLSKSFLEPIKPIVNVSVLWCKISSDIKITSTELTHYLQQHNVHIVPGTYFFWANKSLGENFIRIALARDTKCFTEAIEKLVYILENFKAN